MLKQYGYLYIHVNNVAETSSMWKQAAIIVKFLPWSILLNAYGEDWGNISFKYFSLVRKFHWWGYLNSNNEDLGCIGY